jgi:hypothetical protein
MHPAQINPDRIFSNLFTLNALSKYEGKVQDVRDLLTNVKVVGSLYKTFRRELGMQIFFPQNRKARKRITIGDPLLSGLSSGSSPFYVSNCKKN